MLLMLRSGKGLHSEMAELMSMLEHAVYAQRSEYVPRLEVKRVREVQAIFEDARGFLEELGIPDTLVNCDINVHDILLGAGKCLFTDWTGAAISNPFLVLELLRLQLSQHEYTAKWIPRLVEAYRKRWRMTIAGDRIEQAILLAPLIAIAT